MANLSNALFKGIPCENINQACAESYGHGVDAFI